MFMSLLPLTIHATEYEKFSIPAETGKATQRLIEESSDIVTTPFQIRNANFLVTLGVIGATALTYSFDENIQHKLQPRRNNGVKKAADAAAMAGDPFLHLGLAALVYSTAIATDSPKWKETGEMMGEALILADASTLIIKQTVGRGRPNTASSKHDFKPLAFASDYDSFSSMHTASSFALASVLASTSESAALRFFYYTAATFVGFSRMYQNKHWASDIVLGAALGELSGQIVTRYHTTNTKIAVVPQSYLNGAGLALVGKW